MFQQRSVKKSGQNTFSKYKYFELDDIVPPKTEIFNELNLCDIITFNDNEATLTLVSIENTDETLVFTSPMRELDLKGANAVQLLGGVETYQRRYLYMAVLDIVESDQFDSSDTITPKKNPSTEFADEVGKIVSALDQNARKNAAEIIRRENGGSANFREISDPVVQKNVLAALRKEYANA